MELTLQSARLMQGAHRADALKLSVGENELPAGAEVRLAFLTPAGRRCETSALTLTDGEVDYALPSSLLDASGLLLAQAVAGTEACVFKSEVFAFDVEKSIDASGAPAPGETFYTLGGLAARLNEKADLADLAAVATSGSYNDLTDKPAIPAKVSDLTNDAGYLTNDDLSGMQETLTFDDAPTSGSANPVKSGGVYTALAGKQDTLSFDNSPTANSDNLVKSGKLYNTLADYATKAYVDDAVAGIDEPDLTDYVQSSSLAAVALSGDYDDLTDTPTIPTKTSDLTNDSGFITSSSLSQSLSNYATKSYVSSEIAGFNDVYEIKAYLNFSTMETSDIKHKGTPVTHHDLDQVRDSDPSTAFILVLRNENYLVSDRTIYLPQVVDEMQGYRFLFATTCMCDFGSGKKKYYVHATFDSNGLTVTKQEVFSGSYSDLTNKPSLAAVATSGSYSDLSNTPTIPTKTSDLTNDSGFLTEHQSLSGYVQSSSLAAVATSGSYADLSNKPTIPAVPDLITYSNYSNNMTEDGKTITPKAVKAFVEGKGYQTSTQVSNAIRQLAMLPDDNVSALTNDAGYVTETALGEYLYEGRYLQMSDNVSWLTNDAGYLTEHQSLSDYATKTYADGKDTSYVITCDFSLADFSVSNIRHGNSACTFSDALAAIAAGKRPELRLNYTSPTLQSETAIGDLKFYNSITMSFIALMVADLGGGYSVYLFRAQWGSDGITVTPYVLSATQGG